jgi:hypothetical protein
MSQKTLDDIIRNMTRAELVRFIDLLDGQGLLPAQPLPSNHSRQQSSARETPELD